MTTAKKKRPKTTTPKKKPAAKKRAKAKPRPLTPKQKAFVNEYLVDFNAYQAARRAGYTHKTALSAHKLLKDPRIQAQVEAVQAALQEKADMDKSEAVQILAGIARGRVGDFLNEDGTLDLEAVREAGPGVLLGFDQSQSASGAIDVSKVKLNNPIHAVERIAKLLGWDQPDKVEHSGGVVWKEAAHDDI